MKRKTINTCTRTPNWNACKWRDDNTILSDCYKHILCHTQSASHECEGLLKIKLASLNAEGEKEMKTNYKTVRELTAGELNELRDSYYWECLDAGTIDVDVFDGVTDDMLFEHYADFSFVDDDFFCNTNPAEGEI